MSKTIPPWPVVREAVRKVMLQQGVNVSNLAEMCDLPRSTVRGAMGEAGANADVQWNTVGRMLVALDLDLAWVHSLKAPKRKKAGTA